MNFPSFNLRRFLLSAAISLALPLGALAIGEYARACGFGPDMEAGKLPPHLRTLSLSEAQRDKVFELMHAQAPAMREKGKAMRKVEADLRALSLSPDYSEAKAQALVDSAARTMASLRLAQLQTERKIFDLLTPEQRQKLADFKPLDDQAHERPGTSHGRDGGRQPQSGG